MSVHKKSRLFFWLAGGYLVLFCSLTLSFADEKKFIYDDHGKRDPFWPLVSSSGAFLHYGTDLVASDMVLEGIVADKNGKNMAIINSMVITVNDRIGLYVVEKIEVDRVMLIKGQERYILKLKKEEE